MTKAPSRHRWQFFRAGGVDQVVLAGADLAHLHELDPKLWVALSMPTTGVDVDAKTLELLDLDRDGHIRHPEILAAVKWVLEVYSRPDEIFERGDDVTIAALKAGPLSETAREVLTTVGKPDAKTINLIDVRERERRYSETWLDGDGVIPVEAADGDLPARAALEDVLATQGPVPDRRGLPGVDEARVTAFFTEVRALRDWYDSAAPAAMPLGAATAAAWDAIEAVRAKVTDYFTRCRLAAFDPRATALMMPSDAQLTAISERALAPSDDEVAALPLGKVEPDRALPLTAGVNPAWATRVAALVVDAIIPLVGTRTALTEADWDALVAKLAEHAAWRARRPDVKAASLTEARVRELAGGDAADRIGAIIARDRALAPLVAQLRDLEKLCLYQRDLARVLRNYVNFSDFYSTRDAVFQAGTLYLDGRGCELCVEIGDPARHGTMAPLAGAYLAYCDVVRVKEDKTAEKKAIAAAFTNGDADNLLVGRNGVFFDRLGRDWEATITKVVDNPISIRQAFWAPYKKFARMIEEQVAKRATAAEADTTATLSAAAAATANADKSKVAEPPKKIDVGTVAAIGVAVGGIGTFVAGILTAFLGLGLWMPIGVAALALMISGPSMLLAFMKLRTRNLGPLLDANGWAINGRARINVPFGTALTEVAVLPPGSHRTGRDPYADEGRPWKLYVALAVVLGLAIAWYLGKLDRYLPKGARSTTIMGANAPASVPVTPPVTAPAPASAAGTGAAAAPATAAPTPDKR